jgi:hypothetical protein
MSAPADTMEVEMHRGTHFASITLALVVAAVFLAFSGPIAGSAGAADKKTTIQLVLNQNVAGIPTIKVQPRDAKIWRNKPEKPKMVEWWWTDNDTSYSEIFWEIRYDPSKGGGTANYFGDVDIECGKTEIKVQPEMTDEGANQPLRRGLGNPTGRGGNETRPPSESAPPTRSARPPW